MAGKNPIGWFEIHVKDFDKARDFYGKLFNWEFNQSQSRKTLYWNIFTGEGSIGGGFMKKEKPEHGGQAVVLYVSVEDIDSTMKNVNELGGKTHTPKTLINEKAGYFALFYDNDENLIGLWSQS